VRYLDWMAHLLSQEKARLLALLDLSPGDRVLDVGCGAGHDLRSLADAGAASVGVDPSAHMLAESRQRGRGAERTYLVRGDGEALSFASSSFDAARIERVLLHAHDPRAILEEVRRVLHPGGRLVVFEADVSSISIDSDEPELSDAVVHGVVLGVRQPRIGLQLRALLVDAGYRHVECRADLGTAASLERLRWAFNVDKALTRAIESGLLSLDEADRWRLEMQERSKAQRFWAIVPRTTATAAA
jgi:SAM-dependent methyltransferase